MCTELHRGPWLRPHLCIDPNQGSHLLGGSLAGRQLPDARLKGSTAQLLQATSQRPGRIPVLAVGQLPPVSQGVRLALLQEGGRAQWAG